MMRADSGVVEAILPIAPRAKRHPASAIGINHAVRPSRRHHHFLSRLRVNSDTPSGVVFRSFLRVNDCPSAPNLEDFRRRPATVRGYGVNMPLRAHRLFTKRA